METRAAALLCLVLGAIPVGIGLEVLPVAPETIHAPRIIVVLAGLLFWVCAVSLMSGSRPRWNHFFGGVILAIFAVIGGWVSIYGESDAISGGAPFASRGTNVSVARIVFGAGALLSAGLSLYAFVKAIAWSPNSSSQRDRDG